MEVLEHLLRAVFLDLCQGLPIDPGRSPIGEHPPPRLLQHVRPEDPVKEGVEAPLRRPLGRHAEPVLEASHLVHGRTPVGVSGPGGPGHALTRTSAPGVTKVGALPGRARYYDPAGLPLRSGRLHHRLIRPVFADEAAQTGLSCSGPDLRTRAAPHTPEGPGRSSRTRPAGRGLRRDMSGSAPSLSLCRGCRTRDCSLRPVFLLPPKRLWSSFQDAPWRPV